MSNDCLLSADSIFPLNRISIESSKSKTSFSQTPEELMTIFIGFKEIPSSVTCHKESIAINTGECEKSLSSFIKNLSLIIDDKDKIVKVNPFDFEMVELFGSSHFELKNVDDKFKLFNALIEQTLGQSEFHRLLHQIKIYWMNLNLLWQSKLMDLRTFFQHLRKFSKAEWSPLIEGSDEKNFQLLRFLTKSNLVGENLEFLFGKGSPFSPYRTSLLLNRERKKVRRLESTLKALKIPQHQLLAIFDQLIDVPKFCEVYKQLVSPLPKYDSKTIFVRSYLNYRLGNINWFEVSEPDNGLFVDLNRYPNSYVKNNLGTMTFVLLVRTSPKRRLVLMNSELEENCFVQIFVNENLYFEDTKDQLSFEIDSHRWSNTRVRHQVEDRLSAVYTAKSNKKKFGAQPMVKAEHWNPNGWNILKFHTWSVNVPLGTFRFEFHKEHITEPRKKERKN